MRQNLPNDIYLCSFNVHRNVINFVASIQFFALSSMIEIIPSLGLMVAGVQISNSYTAILNSLAHREFGCTSTLWILTHFRA